MWEKEDEGEEEEREEKDCHEARERESPAGARVGIRIWEAIVVVAPVTPVPLHVHCVGVLLLLPNTVLSCGVLQLHHSGVGDPFYNYNTTHHVTNFDSTLHCCYSLKNYSAMIGSLNIFVC